MEAANLDRRSFLKGGALAAASLALAPSLFACATPEQTEPVPENEGAPARESATPQPNAEAAPAAGSGVLVAFFSRAGENYTSAGIVPTEVGNTSIMAGFVQEALGCDVFEITAADPYPYDYDEQLDRAQAELDADARPAIAGELPDLSAYDTVLVGSGIWWGRPPMIMRTFLEAVDTAGKTVVPFTTHGGSGLGSASSDYQALCPDAALADGLAVSGERVSDSREDVLAWLRDLGLLEG